MSDLCPGKWFTITAMSMVFIVAGASANEDNSTLEKKGDLCESGISSGFACRNVELLARLPLAEIGGGSGADRGPTQ